MTSPSIARQSGKPAGDARTGLGGIGPGGIGLITWPMVLEPF